MKVAKVFLYDDVHKDPQNIVSFFASLREFFYRNLNCKLLLKEPYDISYLFFTTACNS
jgi:hypothetical protein